MTFLECIALLASLLYVLLNARQNMATWTFGLVGSLLYAWVFAQTALYASAGLSLIFAAFMVYGWLEWRKPTANNTALPVSRLSTPQRLLALLVALLVSFIIYALCLHIPGAALLAGDSLIAGFSIVAQTLAAWKKLETWILWIAVNMLAVGIYATGGLFATAVLYAVYIALAVYGLRQWATEKQLHQAGMS